MKTIELRRHGTKDTGELSEMLSPAGIERAKLIGAYEMRDKGYTHLAAAPSTCALQTLAAFIEGAGDMPIVEFSQELRAMSVRMPEWEILFERHGEDVQKIKCASPVLVGAETAAFGEVLREIMHDLPENARQLLVAHSPFIELMVLGVIGTLIFPVSEFEGVVLQFDGSDARVMRLIRYP